MLSSRIAEWSPALKGRWTGDIQFFLDSVIPNEDPRSGRVLRWDNYLPLYLHEYEDTVENLVFVTQKCGSIRKEDLPEVDVVEIDLWKVPDLMGYCVLQHGDFIVNLDLDLFFFQDSADSNPRFWHRKAVETLAEQLRRLVDSTRCIALTIAMSPDCCGGWKPAEEALNEVCEALAIDFRLPPP
jgi:hypothetical protein